MNVILFDDFSSFPLGPFPYDRDHSAMGEYHFIENEGYKGGWFDPIADFDYRGPSWIISSPGLDNSQYMEQMRIKPPKENKAVPSLRKGDIRMEDYTLTVSFRPYRKDEIAGVAFRYQTSMMHYGFYLKENSVEFHRVNKTKRTILGKKEYLWDTDSFHTIKVICTGSLFRCYVDDIFLLEIEDSLFKNGTIALSSSIPTAYASVSLEMTDEEKKKYEEKIKEDSIKVEKKRKKYPQMKLDKTIDLKDFGAGRQIRFGHLTGSDELFFVMAQNGRRVYKDRYPFISCLTAVSMETGKILWQKGKADDSDDVIYLTTDLPFQVYDIDDDGIDEIIVSYNFALYILDGRNASVKKSIPTPLNTAKPETVTGLEFGRYAFDRLNVDAIRICNVSGKDRPSDILIKDRYSRLWLYDSNLNLLWTFSHYNTGHFPYNLDYDKDGKDEIFSCYNMIDDDGKLLWSLPINKDHTDEIIYGKICADKEPCLALVSGWEGFMLVSLDGKILKRDINGHAQRISVGHYYHDKEDLQICVTTYWQNNGIIYMYDSNGDEIWHKEALCNGNIIAPINWDGSGDDLIVLNADPTEGGLMDGEGDVVVPFPSDGHPTLCTEVVKGENGNSRDRLIVWDRKRLCIYSQDIKEKEKDVIYSPIKYDEYNASNYRGEFSFPRWIKRKKV